MPRRKPKRRNNSTTVILTLLIVLMIAATAFVIHLCADLVNKEPGRSDKSSSTITLPGAAPGSETEPAETTQPETVQVVSTATIGAQGDLLMHKPVMNSCRLEDGTYDFESIFRYVSEYTASYDYAVANLETTLGGTDYPYQGNPEFNCPDSILDAVTAAGYDMLLTANNHCSDTHTNGLLRTLEQVRGQGLATLGTQLSDDEDKYAIVDVNGIRIGMLCYTYADSVTSDGRPSLNFREAVKKVGLVNYFTETNLEKFYAEVQSLLAEMEAQGAEATMLYIHWGIEYETTENATQRAIAQKMCDLGIDVIVGGHPHVVQPMDLLSSTTDPDHKTVCIYSLGNAVSNQRAAEMRLNTGHTEDGALFTVTFEKYSDGTVYVAATDVIPTWVNLSSVNGKTEYNILPLDFDRYSEWQSLYNLTDALYASAGNAYDRTMAIVGSGLEECQTYLDQAKADREAYYQGLAAA